MSYFVGCLIEGDAAEYYKQITTELAQRFDIKNLSESIPPHMTLKASFESNQVESFQTQLRDIANTIPVMPFSIRSFERFSDKKTIYLNPDEDQSLQTTATNIIEIIAFFGEQKIPLPSPFKLHISIARYLELETSNRIWNYLTTKAQPCLECKFNNITLFKNIDGNWRTDSMYRFSRVS